MKKKILILAYVFIFGLILSSCRGSGSSRNCSAYGEYKKFQVERR